MRLIRIVKMTFNPEKVADFLKMFDEVKHKIRAVDGCTHLELLQDKTNFNILFTYSYWEGEAFLEVYRKSDLFKNVWKKTKCNFIDKPEAWSVERLVKVD